MHSVQLVKPDGRQLTLYANHALDAAQLSAPSPFGQPLNAEPHLRWHPLRGEWVAYAAYRQRDSFLPPPQDNPFAPTQEANRPTEVPAGDWQVAVFDNRFPSLGVSAAGGSDLPPMIVPATPATGRCEVVVFTQDAQSSLGQLPLAHIELLLQVWGDRTQRLGARDDVQYVLPFENRGIEVGVSLHHPHGQVFAYPQLPPVPARQQQLAAEYHAQHGVGLLQAHLRKELDDGRRILYAGPHAVAFVPVCARHPYEVWVAPMEPVETFAHLGDAQRADLARALKTVLLKYDALWERPFPYLMAWYQAPTDGRPHPESHLHAQFFPPYRMRDRLRHLAGSEIAAGFFTVDALPEDKARELQQVQVSLETEGGR